MQQTSDSIRASYDVVARDYAERFADELTNKPLDRELLRRFALEVADRGLILDLGCGSGQTTGFLHSCGASVRGLDLSPAMVREATQRHPGVSFETGDMLALPCADGSAAGVVAFYGIVHLSPTDLRTAFHEIHRVLQPGGIVLLAFHIGDGSVRVEQFLGHPVALEFVFFQPAAVANELGRAGFTVQEVIEREPYPAVEYPSRRGYAFARRLRAGEKIDSGPGSL